MRRRDRRRRRRIRRGPTFGPSRRRTSLRWEVGAPLMLAGTLVAGLTLGVVGGGLFFWTGALMAGVGLAVFLS